jgi:hypothetical protein
MPRNEEASVSCLASKAPAGLLDMRLRPEEIIRANSDSFPVLR